MKNPNKVFCGGIVIGCLIGSYITFIFSTKYIADKIDICNTVDCIRYEKVNIGR